MALTLLSHQLFACWSSVSIYSLFAPLPGWPISIVALNSVERLQVRRGSFSTHPAVYKVWGVDACVEDEQDPCWLEIKNEQLFVARSTASCSPSIRQGPDN